MENIEIETVVAWWDEALGWVAAIHPCAPDGAVVNLVDAPARNGRGRGRELLPAVGGMAPRDAYPGGIQALSHAGGSRMDEAQEVHHAVRVGRA